MSDLRKAGLLSIVFLAGGCSLGPTELLVILAIVVLLFGATRLPQLGKALGDTVKAFRASTGNDALPEDKGEREVVQIEDAKVERDDEAKKNNGQA